MTIELTLVRHGATEWSTEGRLTGWTDLPLSRDGVSQARALRQRFCQDRFDHVWTSDLLRARQTAAIALPGVARADPRIRELNFGCWEGLRFAELPIKAQGAMIDFDSFRALGGETTDQLISRVREFLSDLPPGRHFVATHGGVMRAIYRSRGLAVIAPAPATVMRVRI